MAKKRPRTRASREAGGESRPVVVSMISLGCAKNTVDSERALGMLAERGFVISADLRCADVLLVNTCAFIAAAREETEETLSRLSRRGKRPAVVALGCYPESVCGGEGGAVFRHGSLPGVEAFVRFEAYDELPAICARLAGAVPEVPEGAGRVSESRFASSPRLRIGSPATAYLKIAEGCSNRCRYCTIPDIRGPLRSVPADELLEEAAGLADLGAKEICVIAQDTASYGTDLDGEPRLPELLGSLCGIGGLRWVRLLYVHPAHLTDALLDTIGGEEKVCRYLDLPIQHVSTPILGAMGRRYTGGEVRELVRRVRERVPALALRTTVMVGFPGETDREFGELVEFVEETRFDHLGAFAYSPERGTPAAGLDPELHRRVPAGTAERRLDILMRAQQEVAFRALDGRVGGSELVMLEAPAEAPGVWLARSEREAPEVDAGVLVRFDRGERRRPGEFLQVGIDQRDGYDLLARPVTGRRRLDRPGLAAGREGRGAPKRRAAGQGRGSSRRRPK